MDDAGPWHRTFYQTLGVSRDASDKEISSAYRRLARQYHPDVTGGDKASEDRFKQINAAHDVLGDPDKRAAYNRWGDQWEHAEELERQQGAFGGFGGFGGRGQPFGGDNVRVDLDGLGDLGGIDLGDLFGQTVGGAFGGRGTSGFHAPPARGRDIEHQVSVSLREAFHGTTRTLQRGASGGRLEVTIPPGVRDGQRIKVTGKGEASPHGQDGDLYLIVELQDDPVFERRGDDLYVPVDVPDHHSSARRRGCCTGVERLWAAGACVFPPAPRTAAFFDLPAKACRASGRMVGATSSPKCACRCRNR